MRKLSLVIIILASLLLFYLPISKAGMDQLTQTIPIITVITNGTTNLIPTEDPVVDPIVFSMPFIIMTAVILIIVGRVSTSMGIELEHKSLFTDIPIILFILVLLMFIVIILKIMSVV